MCSGLPMKKRDAGGKFSQSRIGFLPIVYGREGDEVFIKGFYLERVLTETDESQETMSHDDYNALIIQKNVCAQGESKWSPESSTLLPHPKQGGANEPKDLQRLREVREDGEIGGQGVRGAGAGLLSWRHREPQRWGHGSSSRRPQHDGGKTAFKGEVQNKGELEGYYECHQGRGIQSKRCGRGKVSSGQRALKYCISLMSLIHTGGSHGSVEFTDAEPGAQRG